MKTYFKVFVIFLSIMPILSHSVEKTTVLIVGDSLSSGYGLESGSGWVSLLQQQLADSGSGIFLINDSISGDTTAGGLARIKDGMERHQPDAVIIELGGNDGLRGMSPKSMEGNLTAIIGIARQYGAKPMLIGVKMPPNYGRAYTTAFENAYKKVSEETNTPLMENIVHDIGDNPALMQEDGIHPNETAQPMMRDMVWAFLQPNL